MKQKIAEDTTASELLPHPSIVNFQASLPDLQFSVDIIDVDVKFTNYIDHKEHGLRLKALTFPEKGVEKHTSYIIGG